MRLNKIKNNNSGIVLIMVIAVTAALTFVALSMFGTTISQVQSGRSIVDTMIAEQYALGVFYTYMERSIDPGLTPILGGDSNIHTKNFAYVIDDASNPPGVNNAQPVIVTITYDFLVPVPPPP